MPKNLRAGSVITGYIRQGVDESKRTAQLASEDDIRAQYKYFK